MLLDSHKWMRIPKSEVGKAPG